MRKTAPHHLNQVERLAAGLIDPRNSLTEGVFLGAAGRRSGLTLHAPTGIVAVRVSKYGFPLQTDRGVLQCCLDRALESGSHEVDLDHTDERERAFERLSGTTIAISERGYVETFSILGYWERRLGSNGVALLRVTISARVLELLANGNAPADGVLL